MLPPASEPTPAPNTPTYATAPQEAPVSVAAAGSEPTELRFPDFSVRVDPLNWLLEGHLGFEIEIEAFEWLTLETVPIFVTTNEPFALPSNVREYSDGLGPLSGASLSAGFWLGGNSFQGTVLRAGITNYNYRYDSIAKAGEATTNAGNVLDSVSVSQNRLTLMLGSGRRFGYFTIAGGFGIEYELNDQRRCIQRETSGSMFRTTDEGCARDELILLRRRSEPDAANLRGPFFPVELIFRFSLGVVFDD